MTARFSPARTRPTLTGLAAAAVLALSACTAAPMPASSPMPSETPAPPVTSSAPPVESPTPEPAPVDVPAQLQFSATTVADGAAFEGASLAGKNTILWFWAPWCPVCQAESPNVVAAWAELPEDVTLIGVSGRADVPAMQSFLAQYGVDEFEHVADVDGAIWSNFGVAYQPAFAFIGADGSIRTVPSAMSKADILAGANELVG